MMVPDSPYASSSEVPVMVMVCSSSQLPVVKVTYWSLTVKPLSAETLRVTLTSSAGSESRTRVYVAVPPSTTVREVSLAVTPRSSSSSTVTRRSLVTPV